MYSIWYDPGTVYRPLVPSQPLYEGGGSVSRPIIVELEPSECGTIRSAAMAGGNGRRRYYIGSVARNAASRQGTNATVTGVRKKSYTRRMGRLRQDVELGARSRAKPWKDVNDNVAGKMVSASSDTPPTVPRHAGNKHNRHLATATSSGGDDSSPNLSNQGRGGQQATMGHRRSSAAESSIGGGSDIFIVSGPDTTPEQQQQMVLYRGGGGPPSSVFDPNAAALVPAAPGFYPPPPPFPQPFMYPPPPFGFPPPGPPPPPHPGILFGPNGPIFPGFPPMPMPQSMFRRGRRTKSMDLHHLAFPPPPGILQLPPPLPRSMLPMAIPGRRPTNRKKATKAKKKPKQHSTCFLLCCRGHTQVLWIIIGIILTGVVVGLVLGLTLV